VFVTPSEYDHSAEPEPSYSSKLQGAALKFSHLRLDLTFDEDSQIVQNTLLRRISSGSSLYFDKTAAKSSRSPIKVSDVQTALAKCLTDSATDSKSYFLQGEKAYTYEELIHVLEAAAGQKANLNKCAWENMFKPTSFGFVQELLYTQCYQNCEGIIHSDKTGQDAAAEDGSSLVGGSKAQLTDFYTPNSFAGMKSHGHSFLKKFLLQ
jgi:uncharacterized protein YbjT (DUF2867 family)